MAEKITKVRVKGSNGQWDKELPIAVQAENIIGTISADHLPSYVDDVLEFPTKGDFPKNDDPEPAKRPEKGKIYIALDTGLAYRWGGSEYIEISSPLELGDGEKQAYPGNKGKEAYDHAMKHGSAFSSGLYKITTNEEGHVTTVAPPEKKDIPGLNEESQRLTNHISAIDPHPNMKYAASDTHAGDALKAKEAEHATKADSIKTENETVDEYRDIFFADSASKEKLNYNNKIQANPAKGIIRATRFEGKADSAGSAPDATARADAQKAQQTIDNHKAIVTGNPHNVTKKDVGLENVENKSSATIRSEITKEDVTKKMESLIINYTAANGGGASVSSYNGSSETIVHIIDSWRPIQDNLISDSFSDSLSAKQGKILKGLVDKCLGTGADQEEAKPLPK